MTDYTDLLARLRQEAETASYAIEPATFYLEAAAAIERLEAERDTLRGAVTAEALAAAFQSVYGPDASDAFGPYAFCEDPSDALLDGHFNLHAVAAALTAKP